MILPPLSISQAPATVVRDIRGHKRNRETADPTSRARRSERRSGSDFDVERWRYRLIISFEGGVDIQCSGKGCTK